MPRSVKFATPFTAVAVVVPRSVPPADTEAVTTLALSVITTLEFASWSEITGCVVKVAPDAVPAAAVVRTS